MSIRSVISRGIRYVLYGIPTQIEHHTTAIITLSAPGNLLEKKSILITGGSSGLGKAFAKRSVEEGADVIITGRNEKALKDTCDEIGNDRIHYMVRDAQDISELPAFFAEAQEIMGGKKINCLVSNAGISLHEGNFRNVTEENWDQQFDTNLKGNYFLVSAFIQYLEQFEDKSGNIVVITSERAKRPDDIPYGLTKVATSSFIQAIASKVINEDIRINGVGPGVTASHMTGFDRDGNLYAEWQPEKRVFVPEEIAEVVNFLLSDISSCISGEIITCNRGKHISHW